MLVNNETVTKEMERREQVEIGDPARRVLEHLAMAKGSFLFGKRHGTMPMTLIDNAAPSEHRIVADSLRLLDRCSVDQLVAADYLNNNTGTNESVNISFRISEKGRRLFSHFKTTNTEGGLL